MNVVKRLRGRSRTRDNDNAAKKVSACESSIDQTLPRAVVDVGSNDQLDPDAIGKDTFDPDAEDEWIREEREFLKMNDATDAKIWFMVDIVWLKKWKSFINASGTFPGPVDNHRLVDRRSGEPRPGLRIVNDYRGVNYRMWKYWHRRYGGGPEIRRKELDLYSAVAEDLEGTTLIPVLPPGAKDLDATRDVPRLDPVQEPPMPRAATPRGRKSSQANAAERRSQSVPPAEAPRKGKLCCDKCDGAHETDDCPYFKKAREKHKDAWVNVGKKGTAWNKVDQVPIIKKASVVRQPGDGSCLFHSLNYGLTGNSSGGASLRREICNFMKSNPDIEIGDNVLSDWVYYENGTDVVSYARSMSGSSWGGGIEMAAFAKMNGVNVHVFETCRQGYRCISAFEDSGARKTVRVLYQGRAHYDALEI